MTIGCAKWVHTNWVQVDWVHGKTKFLKESNSQNLKFKIILSDFRTTIRPLKIPFNNLSVAQNIFSDL